MLNARAKMAPRFFFLAACASLFLTAGCFTRLNVDRPAPPTVELKDYQPVALLPAADAPGFAGSGSLLVAASREALRAKNFSVTDPEKGLQAFQDLNRDPREISRNADLLRRFGESSRSRIVLVATFLEFRRQKSYISPGTSQVWQGAAYEYQSLPTYHQGVCEMRVSLKLLDAQKGLAVWTAEGKGRGPSGSEEGILSRLVADLMKDLPLLSEKRE